MTRTSPNQHRNCHHLLVIKNNVHVISVLDLITIRWCIQQTQKPAAATNTMIFAVLPPDAIVETICPLGLFVALFRNMMFLLIFLSWLLRLRIMPVELVKKTGSSGAELNVAVISTGLLFFLFFYLELTRTPRSTYDWSIIFFLVLFCSFFLGFVSFCETICLVACFESEYFFWIEPCHNNHQWWCIIIMINVIIFLLLFSSLSSPHSSSFSFFLGFEWEF